MEKKSFDLPRAYNYPTILFLLITPPLAFIGTWYWFSSGMTNYPTVVLTLAFFVLTGMGITVGYHRLFAHQSFKTNPVMEILFLLWGAASWQGSALDWSVDHRLHHQRTDTPQDPYNIRQGFWYAHILWLFHKRQRQTHPERDRDLFQNPRIMWQDRYYGIIATLMGFVLPTALAGLLWQDFWGGFFLAGVLRMTVNHHLTFAINSICHLWGSRPYSEKHSARDNWLAALFTYGEGYHNFHHEFPTDYRNGIKWYHWDPSKWVIFLMAKLGLAHNLKRTPVEKIILRKWQVKEKSLKALAIDKVAESLDHYRSQLTEAIAKLKFLRQYATTKPKRHPKALAPLIRRHEAKLEKLFRQAVRSPSFNV
ncbi:MAG: fatty acid desaturase [Leptospiraceae bacterium]|nr:fatty acid desaturase [Leptospiraceae bacterium]MDW8306218.1 fatty acid desaturase [Leptospiraceae bacterium]